jgi:hypothetical protein
VGYGPARRPSTTRRQARPQPIPSMPRWLVGPSSSARALRPGDDREGARGERDPGCGPVLRTGPLVVERPMRPRPSLEYGARGRRSGHGGERGIKAAYAQGLEQRAGIQGVTLWHRLSPLQARPARPPLFSSRTLPPSRRRRAFTRSCTDPPILTQCAPKAEVLALPGLRGHPRPCARRRGDLTEYAELFAILRRKVGRVS